MKKQNSLYRMTTSEMQIMTYLWNSKEPAIASQIVSDLIPTQNCTWKPRSVFTILKSHVANQLLDIIGFPPQSNHIGNDDLAIQLASTQDADRPLLQVGAQRRLEGDPGQQRLTVGEHRGHPRVALVERDLGSLDPVGDGVELGPTRLAVGPPREGQQRRGMRSPAV